MIKHRSVGSYAVHFGTLIVLGMALAGCPNPFDLQDDVERDLDRPLPDIAEVEHIADPGDPDLPYNTQPVWTWKGDPEFGTNPAVFRYRVNGSGWTILVMAPEDQPPYSYSIAEELDEGGNQRQIFPGTYLFEVQERNSAGNWSASAETTTTILVRPPVYTVGGVPGDFTNNAVPFFEWGQWMSTGEPPEPQYGATNTYSWRLERRNGNQWEPLEGENGGGTTAEGVNSHSVSSPLADGQYRFGVAEWNQGGERSAFVWTLFTVDTVPPNPPIHTTAERIVATLSPTWTWATGGPDGNGTYRWWLRSDGSVPVPDSDPLTGGPASITSFSPDNALTEGAHKLYVQERDEAGNWSEFGVFEVTVDPNIPSFTLTGFVTGPPAESEYIYGADESVTFEYGTSGTQQVQEIFQYSTNNGVSWSPDRNNVTEELNLPDGVYLIRVRQKRTDNTYTPASIASTVVVDTVPPGMPMVSGPGFDGAMVSTFLNSVTIDVSDPDNDSTVVFDVDVQLDGANVLPRITSNPAGPMEVELGIIGSFEIFVIARDRANNIASVFSEQVTVIPNDSPIVTSLETPTLNQQPTWTWTSVAGLDVYRYRYSLNGGAWTETFDESFTPGVDLAAGFYVLDVQQQDDLGVWSLAGSFQVEVLESGTGSVEMTIVFQDPVNEVFILPSPGTIPRGTPITVTLESTIAFDDVMWLVNGLVVDGVLFTPPATQASLVLTSFFTETLPLGINRIAVLVNIDDNWYSSEDMTFEVVQP